MTEHIDKLILMEERLAYLNRSLGLRKDDSDIAEWARMFSPELLDVHSRFIQDLKYEYEEVLEDQSKFIKSNSYTIGSGSSYQEALSLQIRKSQIEYAIEKFFQCFP